MNNEKECAVYFQTQKAYCRAMEEMRKKWRSYGKAAGRITLKDTSEEERRAVSGITGKRYLDDTVCFSFAEFERGLQKTRFEPVDMQKLLECYFHEEMITNQRQMEQEQNQKQQFLKKIWNSVQEETKPESTAAQWLSAMISEKKFGWQIVMREYEKNVLQTEKMVRHVCCAVSRLEQWKQSEEIVPLAVAAAEISGNPHYLDRNTTEGTLFTQAVCWYEQMELPQNTYQWRERLQCVGIVPDNISSMVHVFGIRLKKQEVWHPAYDAFWRCREPYVLTMENLKGITGAQPVGKCVYIVENEMVFSYLLEQIQKSEVSLLCTSEQPRYAALKLISLIVQSGIPIYYSGDLDPDGIGIADRLWQRFGDAIHIWRMTPEDYRKSLSNEIFGESGQKKLEHIVHPVLRKTVEVVKKTGKAGYQENILKELSGDIIR